MIMVLYGRYVDHHVAFTIVVCTGCAGLISALAIDCISLLFLRLKNSLQQVTLLAVWMRSLVMWINQCVVLHSLTVEVMNRLAYPLPLR